MEVVSKKAFDELTEKFRTMYIDDIKKKNAEIAKLKAENAALKERINEMVESRREFLDV